MILAAGLGTRMRAFRSDIPKPLVPVAGRALIDRVLDKFVAAGVNKAVVNVSHMGRQIMDHLAARQDIALAFSPEDEPLETGGGIVKALPLLGMEPFFVANADTLWEDGATPALMRLAERFDDQRMDALLLACPLARTRGYEGRGDFILDADGKVRRARQGEAPDSVFAGVQILHPRILAPFTGEGAPKKFSLNQLFHAGEGQGWFDRIYALKHDGVWMHVGDAKGVQEAEAQMGVIS